MIRCVDCARFVYGDREMAAHGLGNCKTKPAYQYYSAVFPHECGLFQAASREDVERRLHFLNRKMEAR